MGQEWGVERSLRGVAILIAEADAVLASTMEGFLEAAGAFPVVVGRAADAMAETTGDGPRFDAAVIGASLPDGCGVDLACGLESHLPLERIFITTNFHFTAASEASTSLPVERLPLTMPDLLRTLAHSLSSRRMPAVTL